jgi:pyruvate/2-oxoglutarate dehydrogenase complex dihydrolipoamide dehydrogenase (E3) component
LAATQGAHAVTAPLAPDVCVIGAGSAGLTVAAAARAVGLDVVLIERGRMGGECLNTGCVPSKALIAAARAAASIRAAGGFGVEAGPVTVDAPRVFAHVRDVVASIAPHDSRERFEALGATVIAAAARFVDPRTVEAGGRTIRARRFVVATGSRPALPPVPGLDAVPFLTNESVFDLDALPGRLVVLGAGAVGLELAQAFARLGSRVTVVEAARPLAAEDEDCVAVVLARLAAEGVVVLDRARAVSVSGAGVAADGGIVVEIERDGVRTRLPGDALLVATGRRANVEDLGLDAAGIRHDARGIVTDAALRTSNRRVFAIGDVAGAPGSTHRAGYQGGLVVRTILTGWPHRERPERACGAVFTDPEIARVGLSEAEARARHGAAVTVHRTPVSANDRARADRATEGVVKLVTGRGGRVLGAALAGHGAAETAAVVALAVAGRQTVTDLAGLVLPYPTLAETVKRAATGALAGRLEAPAVRGVLAGLRRFWRIAG